MYPTPTLFATPGLRDFAQAVDAERQRQLERWGDQRHPDGTGQPGDWETADLARRHCQAMSAAGLVTWRDIVWEEAAEAFAETDPERLAAELIQLASLCQAWVVALSARVGRDLTAPGRPS
ncbi:hypothetical protein [Streptomyces sp. DH37]|uniref:hypothetical protein n=1 Tax=Streptomyces sp. DH37 TaxID=3040122 RepID=UPI002442CA5F|nr:hypothetical protein [Streptomyces sp. DH37]MDG9703743.1 hypothetical protein [Streptomyces sp. DH37]